MTRAQILVTLLVSLVLPALGSAEPSKVLRLYKGPELPAEQVVTLLPPTGVSMVLRVDEKIAGGSCFTNCMFRRPVQILPGQHRFASNNMHMPPIPKGQVAEPVPFSSSAVASLKVVNTSLPDLSLELDFEATLDAGKSYAMRIGHVDQAGGPREMYIWWQEIPDAPLEE